MIVTTTDDLPDKKAIQILGMARGRTARERNIGRGKLRYRKCVWWKD